jgi:transcription elongation factor Elf1
MAVVTIKTLFSMPCCNVLLFVDLPSHTKNLPATVTCPNCSVGFEVRLGVTRAPRAIGQAASDTLSGRDRDNTL